jgi:hypothetical protein
MESGCNLLPHDTCFVNQEVEVAARLQAVDDRTEAFEQFASAFNLLLEGIQPLVVPAREHFLKAVDDEGNVNVDFGLLSNAIQATDALLQDFRI